MCRASHKLTTASQAVHSRVPRPPFRSHDGGTDDPEGTVQGTRGRGGGPCTCSYLAREAAIPILCACVTAVHSCPARLPPPQDLSSRSPGDTVDKDSFLKLFPLPGLLGGACPPISLSPARAQAAMHTRSSPCCAFPLACAVL